MLYRNNYKTAFEPNKMSQMKKIVLLIAVILFTSCQQSQRTSGVFVGDIKELKEAIANASPGTEIIMANGNWDDVEIRFYGLGTENQPIVLKAESPGEVIISGQSNLRLGGAYLVVDGLHFKNGASPSQSVIQFFINNDTLANNSIVTNCVIEDFNKAQRDMSDLWIRFKGRNNQLDHCYIAGKSNRGPTVRVDLEGNESIKNYHKIVNNHFGPRPPKGGPSAETIQIGNSSTSMTPSHTLVANNLFDRCNGEVEVISSKSNFNEFRNNVFYKSQGSLVTRHGNYCLVDGNYFIGDENSPQVGGIRLIGTGHTVTNNYFYKLRGEIFRGPIAMMNGINKPAINRYFQVTDVVVAFNTWVDCKSPLQIGVGSNIDQRDVLPASEIRSETPERTLVASNVIYNSKGDSEPIKKYDSVDGVEFKSNVINNQGVEYDGVEGLMEKDFSMKKLSENLFVPAEGLSNVDVYKGFEFDKIDTDLFGNSRKTNNTIGAVSGTNLRDPNIMDLAKYGPKWYASVSESSGTTHSVNTADELAKAIEAAKSGDVIEIVAAQIAFDSSIKLDKALTIRSANEESPSTLKFGGASEVPAFEMNPDARLTLKSVNLSGNGENYAFATLKENMSSLYNLTVVDSEISEFDYVLKGYKFSFSEFIRFESTTIQNCNNGIELAAEVDDKGDYNAENVFIINCLFDRVKANVIDYYRGGYDESTVGGNLLVRDSEFTQCGASEETGILINTYGIINVDLSGNVFRNNQVELVARLWGAKNNTHSDNEIQNSGELVVQENLPLKLMY